MTMKNYYKNKLSGNHLHQVYALASDPVRAYLHGEIEFCRGKIQSGNQVLELGCGYGRIVKALAADKHSVTGIDNAPLNIESARAYLQNINNVDVITMNVNSLEFDDESFDCVLCLQNGLSAFGMDPLVVLKEGWRVTKKRGCLICSTYSDAFWPYRLAWFHEQANAGLLGEIDNDKSNSGIITCKDGFISRSTRAEDFRHYAELLNLNVEICTLNSGSLIATYTV